MLRLAVTGVDEPIRQGIGSRLRGVVLVSPGEGADATAFLAPTPADASEVQSALARGAVLLAAPLGPVDRTAPLAIANPDRYLPSVRLIKGELAASKLGEPGLVRLHRWEPAPGDPSALLRDLDLVVWLLNRPPECVFASLTEGYTQVHLGFPGGGMALLDHARRLPPGDGYRSLTVIGSAGAAYADDHHDMQLVFQGGRPQATRTGEGVRHLVAMLQEFADSLREDRDLSASVTSWCETVRLSEVVRRSQETRQVVSLGVPKGGAPA